MIHSRTLCDGEPCPFHAPSAHHMSDWPTYTRPTRLVERICPHGTGHPDPDSLAYFRRSLGDVRFTRLRLDSHGCDGCCSPIPENADPVVDDHGQIVREPVPDAFQRMWD